MSDDNYCRLCAMKIENCIKIYDEEGEQLNLATKIIQCLQIWLYPEDVLPKTICEDCCTKVNLFFEFFQICSQSQISLMSMFKDKNYEDKMYIDNIEEINGKNSLDVVYEEDHDNINSEPTETEECNEYTDLSGPTEQEKISCKHKVYLPAENPVDDDVIVIPVTQTNTEDVQEANIPQVVKRGRKCKETAKPALEDDEDNVVDGTEEDGDSEVEDEPKLTRRGLGDYVWRCISCQEVLPSVGELRRHHETEHGQAPVFACMHCNKSYTRYRSFSRHAQAHINRNKFRDPGSPSECQNSQEPVVGHQLIDRKRSRSIPNDDDERLNGTSHFLYEVVKKVKRDCVVCTNRASGLRKRTRFYCNTCEKKPGLHPGECFERYHTLKEFKRDVAT